MSNHLLCIHISGGTNKLRLRLFPSYDFENVANMATSRSLVVPQVSQAPWGP